MGMAAILVINRDRFVPPSHGSSTLNLILIGQAVSEEKIFKECGRQTTEDRQTNDRRQTDERQTDDGGLPSAQMS